MTTYAFCPIYLLANILTFIVDKNGSSFVFVPPLWLRLFLKFIAGKPSLYRPRAYFKHI